MSACEREWPGPELGHEHAAEVSWCIAEPFRKSWYAVPLNRAVGDQAHRPRGEIIVDVPLGRTGHRIGKAALAGAQPRLMRGGSGAIKTYVRRLRCHRRATRSAVDTRGVHPGDELSVEAGIPRRHGAIPLGEPGI